LDGGRGILLRSALDYDRGVLKQCPKARLLGQR
jgi:hypothetical protein